MGEGKDKARRAPSSSQRGLFTIRTERKKCNVPQRRLPLLTFQVKRERERERERERAKKKWRLAWNRRRFLRCHTSRRAFRGQEAWDPMGGRRQPPAPCLPLLSSCHRGL